MAERTRRFAKRPKAYAVLVALTAAALAAGVAGTMSMAQRSDQAPGPARP